MRTILVIIILTILTFSCLNETGQKEFTRLEVWEDIQSAVKENRIDYLIKISSDTLDCIECNNGKSWVLKEDFFYNHLTQMKQKENKKYTINKEDIKEEENGFYIRYRINYSEEYKGNKYNTIYTILIGEKGYQFIGVKSIP